VTTQDRDFTDPILADIQRAIDSLECDHVGKRLIRYRIASNGSKMLKVQCTRCGELIGDWIPHHKVPNIESVKPIDDDLRQMFIENAHQLRQELMNRKRQIDRGEFFDWYQGYLQGAKWQEKRRLVLNRCNGICEGCGKLRATIVHHLSYDNVGDEFLFQLVGLCQDCHGRVHAECSKEQV